MIERIQVQITQFDNADLFFNTKKILFLWQNCRKITDEGLVELIRKSGQIFMTLPLIWNQRDGASSTITTLLLKNSKISTTWWFYLKSHFNFNYRGCYLIKSIYCAFWLLPPAPLPYFFLFPSSLIFHFFPSGNFA